MTNTMPRRLDCPVGGVAMTMASSSPLNIVQGSIELLMGPEAGPRPRDRARWPAAP